MRVRHLPLAGGLLLAGCYYSNEQGRALELRVDRLNGANEQQGKQLAAQQEKLDAQLPRIDQKITEVTRALDALDQASKRTGADTGVQLQKTVEDVAQLRGQVDAYVHTVDQLQAQVQQLQGGEARSGGGAEAAAKKAAEEVPRPADKREFFALAQSKARAGDTAVSRQLYQDFIRKYPRDELTADAHLNLGESFFSDDRCQEALPEYGQVIKNFPKSKPVPLAYLRSADCFQRLKNPEAARLALEQVIQDYPRSEAAKQAKTKLAELKRPGARKR